MSDVLTIQDESSDSSTLDDEFGQQQEAAMYYLNEVLESEKKKYNLSENLIKKVSKNSNLHEDPKLIDQVYSGFMGNLESWHHSTEYVQSNLNDMIEVIDKINSIINNNKVNNKKLVQLLNNIKLKTNTLEFQSRKTALDEMKKMPRNERKEVEKNLGPYKGHLFPTKSKKGGKKRYKNRKTKKRTNNYY